MSTIPREVVRELIRTEKPQSTQEVLDLLKEMFKDVLQGALEAELDEHLGYERMTRQESRQRIIASQRIFSQDREKRVGPHRAANPTGL